jgi:hypothetical protein
MTFPCCPALHAHTPSVLLGDMRTGEKPTPHSQELLLIAQASVPEAVAMLSNIHSLEQMDLTLHSPVMAGQWLDLFSGHWYVGMKAEHQLTDSRNAVADLSCPLLICPINGACALSPVSTKPGIWLSTRGKKGSDLVKSLRKRERKLCKIGLVFI